MVYTSWYASPTGRYLLAERDESLIGVWREKQKYFAAGLPESTLQDENASILRRTEGWLDRYFAGGQPDARELPLAPEGNAFRKLIWGLLEEIPYGKTATYGQLAQTAAERMGQKSLSAQCIGGAVGRNPVAIIIPCHRVIGAHGDLTGYAGGISVKAWLLAHEGACQTAVYAGRTQ